MGLFVFVLIVVALLALVALQQAKVQLAAREAHVRNAVLPQGLFAELRKKRPELTQKDCELVAHAMRQFFLAYLKSGRRYVSMPSQVVDELWHAFILNTRQYELFCQKAFGGFLHHTPAVALKDERQSDQGLWRCWFHVCKEEHVNPYRPTRLPLLFALDAKLKLPDGFVYALDCKAPAGSALNVAGGSAASGVVVHCAADLRQARERDSGCSGGGSSSSDRSDASDGSGDGGGGCGGGCGS
jgi:hypothetical protein